MDSVRFAKVAVIVCDSAGCGDAPDAADFGDASANTLGHVLERTGPRLPNLDGLGLRRVPGLPPVAEQPGPASGAWGRLTEHGPGKDTMLGHWELMGVCPPRPLPLYPAGFPPTVIAAFVDAAGRRVIGNRAASGTAIIQELGPEHLHSGDLIVYTSADSVFQVAAHEDVVSPDELYEICRRAREVLVGGHAVGRVIARPFVGDAETGFRRTSGRKDFPLPPPGQTVLDHLETAGHRVVAVGKIGDIFAGRGIAEAVKTADNAAGIAATAAAIAERDCSMVFTNLVDFDTEYGHRNDPAGYARALEELDHAIPGLLAALPEDGLLMLTADHGNDPTTPGTDHTRERVPILVSGERIRPRDLGTRDFADLGATVLEALGVEAEVAGRSFLGDLVG